MSDVNVVWALINYGPIFSPVYDTHLRASAIASRHFAVNHLGTIGGMGATDRMYTHSAENKIVEEFLSMEHATHLFMTESDMLLPDETLVKLIALDKDIASGLYFLRKGNGQPCLYKKSVRMRGAEYAQSPVTLFPQDKPFKLNGCCGLGCVLIKRQVLETLSRPWFDLKEDTYGSDIYFYHHVAKEGFEVWVDPTVQCAQIEYKLWGVQDYRKRLEEEPGFAASGAIIGFADYDGNDIEATSRVRNGAP